MRISRLARVLVFLGLCLGVAARPVQAQASARWTAGSSSHVVVDFLDVGQGDSILIRSPEGKTALVDAGPTRDLAAQLLSRKGVESVDIVIVSHHHRDHYGGMEQVIRHFKPRYYMATGSAHTAQGYLRLLQTVKSEGISVVEPTGKPRRIELGSVLLTVLPQPPNDEKEENNNSIGVRLQYGDFSLLMTGDSETAARRWWMSNCPDLARDCTILKLAHHGSHNGTDQPWLDLVNPEVAVAILGRDNSYGHPHSQVISLLRRNEVPLLRTDRRGTITVVSDGRTWNLVSPALARRRSTRGEEAVATTGARESSSSARQSARSRRR